MQHRRNTGAMPILPMITLLREFLIVSCVLCVPQVDSSLYQIKHCLSLVLYGKYSTQRVVSRRNIALGFASCYICLSPTLFVLYFLYITRGSALSNTYICCPPPLAVLGPTGPGYFHNFCSTLIEHTFFLSTSIQCVWNVLELPLIDL